MTVSIEQKKYLKKIKFQKIFILSVQVLIVISFITIWEILSKKNLINSFIYSSPSKIFWTIKNLIRENNLFNHVFWTLKEILISFFLGSTLGLLVAIILYEFKILAKIFEPFLIMFNSLPKVALGPLIIIVFGANIKSVIMMTLLINLIVTIMNLYNGFVNIDQNKIVLMKSFKSSRYQILKYLIIPESLSTIISTIKINVSMTLIGVIMGEFLVSKEGIGYLIIYGTQIFNMDLVMSGIFMLIIISIIIYLLVSCLLEEHEK